MSEPIIVNLALSPDQVDAIARRVALVVANEVITALRSSGQAAAASTTSDRPPDDARRSGRFGRGDITDGQLRVLRGWRNVKQLETVLAIIVGSRDVELETLSKSEASAVLDELTPADRRRNYTR